LRFLRQHLTQRHSRPSSNQNDKSCGAHNSRNFHTRTSRNKFARQTDDETGEGERSACQGANLRSADIQINLGRRRPCRKRKPLNGFRIVLDFDGQQLTSIVHRGFSRIRRMLSKIAKSPTIDRFETDEAGQPLSLTTPLHGWPCGFTLLPFTPLAG
jgi:hypothetical protein